MLIPNGAKLRLMKFTEVKELVNARKETEVLLEDRFGLKADTMRCIGYEQGVRPFVIFNSGDTETLDQYGTEWRCWCVDKTD
jgi:hypothetical protein